MAVTINSREVFNSGTHRCEIATITFTAPDTSTTVSSRLSSIKHVSVHAENSPDALADVTGRSVAVSGVIPADTVSLFMIGR